MKSLSARIRRLSHDEERNAALESGQSSEERFLSSGDDDADSTVKWEGELAALEGIGIAVSDHSNAGERKEENTGSEGRASMIPSNTNVDSDRAVQSDLSLGQE